MKLHCKMELSSRPVGRCLILAVTMTLSSLNYAYENSEPLGVINGGMIPLDEQIEFMPFLSGRPLFRYEVDKTRPAITQIQIEYVQLPSGLTSIGEETLWIQSSAELVSDNSAGAPLQLPIQVSINGRPVKVKARVNSRGVMVTLPVAARQILIQPAGAIRLIVPKTYRGDIRANIRMLEILPADNTAQ